MAPSVLLTLCLLFQTAPAGDQVVARTEELSWSRSEFGEWLVARHGVSALYDFVAEQVVLTEAGKRGMLPTDAQLAAAYDTQFAHLIEVAYSGDPQRWESDQIRSGYTPESAREIRLAELRVELAMDAMIRADRDVSEPQVQARFLADYGENGERMSIELLHFSAYRGLVPGTRPDLPALKADALARAEKVRAAWLAGAKVEDLLADADDPGRDYIIQGLYAEYRPHKMGKDVDAAVAALDKVGDVSPPVEVFDGNWLVRLRSREAVTLAQMHDDLVAELRNAPIDAGEQGVLRNSLMERYKPEMLLH